MSNTEVLASRNTRENLDSNNVAVTIHVDVIEQYFDLILFSCHALLGGCNLKPTK